jgi:predicted dithiol-disulfide oxidoreductase (DUF899 family)
MEAHKIVSRAEWIEARKHLLADEKEFTKARDRLSSARRELPWVRVDKPYTFDGPNGKETLAELFAGRSQLVIYHFMYGPEMEAACKSCSFWADNFERIVVHLNARDVTMIAVSRSPFARLDAFRQRMGWTFKWVSSAETDFNFDYHVSFTRDEIAKGETHYNYAPSSMKATEMPGISVFYKDPAGTVFHTYSCYARGIDMMNAAYQYLDLVPKGRDESGPHAMAWVRYRDSYGR